MAYNVALDESTDTRYVVISDDKTAVAYFPFKSWAESRDLADAFGRAHAMAFNVGRTLPDSELSAGA